MGNILGQENEAEFVPEELAAEISKEEWLFASDSYPTFKTTLPDGTKIQFKDKIFKTSDATITKALLDLMKVMPSLNQAIRYVDVEAARKLVEADLANRRPGAVKGAANTANMRLDARDEKLAELTAQQQKDLEERIQREDLELTQSANAAQKESSQHIGAVEESKSGFIPLEDTDPSIPLDEVKAVATPVPQAVANILGMGAKPNSGE